MVFDLVSSCLILLLIFFAVVAGLVAPNTQKGFLVCFRLRHRPYCVPFLFFCIIVSTDELDEIIDDEDDAKYFRVVLYS